MLARPDSPLDGVLAADAPPAAKLEACVAVVTDFLESKCFTATQRALRTEIELLLSKSTSSSSDVLVTRNLWASRLEGLLGAELPRRADESPMSVVDLTPHEAPSAEVSSSLDPDEANIAAGSCATSSSSRKQERRRTKLIEMRPVTNEEEARELRRQRGKGSSQARVVFHDGETLDEEARRSLAHISLPLLYNPHVNGLEEYPELKLTVGTMVAQR